MKIMTARFSTGSCKGCGDSIRKGQSIAYFGKGRIYHANCKPSDDPAADRQYFAGIADARAYQQDKAMFGEEMAERFEMDREMFRYNHGLDDY